MAAAASHSYPRPDFQRSNLQWQTLNGKWDMLFDDADVGLNDGWHHDGLPSQVSADGDANPNVKQPIEVPYVFQAPASGINQHAVHEVLWYERQIDDIRRSPEEKKTNRLILRFGAVDYEAKVWVDGQHVGGHRGGHVPFDIDISDAIRSSKSSGPYRLTVRVYDSAYDLTQPRGKQYWGPKPEDIFYTPSSGIWQSVWLESVSALRIANSSHGTTLRCADIDRGVIDARIAVLGRRAQQKCSIELSAKIAGVSVGTSSKQELPRDEDFVRFDLDMRMDQKKLDGLPAEFQQKAPLKDVSCWRDGVALWSPEHPLLYDLKITLYDSSGVVDTVETTAGMRSLNWTTGDGTFRLNGQPYFQSLLLDQGYWPETLMTPPSSGALKTDIELSKAMGFNGCRKHQKVEDPIFMYWADRLGFLVWGEMASCYNFSMDMVDRFDQEWTEMIKRDINHPCVITWTPVNESWGYPDLGRNPKQRDHIRSLYYMTKTLDATRPINDNCGWEHVKTDLSTFHDYADADGMAKRCKSPQAIFETGRSMFLKPIEGASATGDEGSKHLPGAPVMCTEFGGVNVAVTNDESRKTNWGYTTASDSEDLLKRVDGLLTSVVKDGHCCAIVWTQLTDIEQEMNGLYSYDRKPKVDAAKMKQVMEKAQATYFSNRSGARE